MGPTAGRSQFGHRIRFAEIPSTGAGAWIRSVSKGPPRRNSLEQMIIRFKWVPWTLLQANSFTSPGRTCVLRCRLAVPGAPLAKVQGNLFYYANSRNESVQYCSHQNSASDPPRHLAVAVRSRSASSRAQIGRCRRYGTPACWRPRIRSKLNVAKRPHRPHMQRIDLSKVPMAEGDRRSCSRQRKAVSHVHG